MLSVVCCPLSVDLRLESDTDDIRICKKHSRQQSPHIGRLTTDNWHWTTDDFFCAHKPVSRILSPDPIGMAIIHLVPPLLAGSSDLPESCSGAGHPSSPIWSCSVWGLPCHEHRCPRGALLPHLFTLTPMDRGGMFSVALSVPKAYAPIARRSSFGPRR